ncbi:MAG: hypothetical protein VB089_14510, partial [Anaerolineaceae bacterium]|nr:hypothetical protein [Anaerolineaceae bacterium]
AILSMGDVYGWISSLPIPFLTAERVSARFIVIPLFFLILLASRQFQHSLDHSRLSPLAALLTVGALCLLALELWQHLQAWQVTRAVSAFETERFYAAKWVVSNYEDGTYFTKLRRGAWLSVASLAGLLGLARWGNLIRWPAWTGCAGGSRKRG